MHDYVQTKRPPASQRSTDAAGPEQQTGGRAAAPGGASAAHGSVTGSLNASPRAQALLAMKTALDESPQVKAQLTMQRMLNSGPALRAGQPLGGAAGRTIQLNNGNKKKGNKSLLNAAKYSPDATKHLVKRHGEQAVTKTLGEGKVKVAGHGSGSSGSGQHPKTTGDLANLNAAMEKEVNENKTAKEKTTSNKKGPRGKFSEAEREQDEMRKNELKAQKARDKKAKAGY
jgi:hypothetical protein